MLWIALAWFTGEWILLVIAVLMYTAVGQGAAFFLRDSSYRTSPDEKITSEKTNKTIDSQVRRKDE